MKLTALELCCLSLPTRDNIDPIPAWALAAEPPVLLADEPTGNLDGENTRIVMEILRNLAHEENRCFIVVTHDPEVADTADLVLRMKDGELTRN